MPLFSHCDLKVLRKLSSSVPIGLDCMICNCDCVDILEGMRESPTNREKVVEYRTVDSAV